MIIRPQTLPWYLAWKGLLGTKKSRSIFFQTRFGIHTFGMCYPIDVVIMDNNCVVKVIKQNLVPNRIFLWNPVFKNVLELPEGMVQQKKISIGTTLQIN